MTDSEKAGRQEKLELMVAVAKEQFEEIVELKEKNDEQDVSFMIAYGLAKGWLSHYRHVFQKTGEAKKELKEKPKKPTEEKRTEE